MKFLSKYKLFILLSIVAQQLLSQSTEGLTRTPDYSYTTQIAYEKTLKEHPDIKIVEEFDFDSVIEEKDITYCTLDNRKLKLDVFKPNRISDNNIAIIIIHGGGWRSGSRTQHYPLAQKLADLGYVCFTPEYRLSTEALFPAAVYDVKSAIRWVRQNASKYGLDEKKIAVLGFSAGGELAAFMGTTGNMPLFEGAEFKTSVSSVVNAVIDIDGTLSFVHPESGEGDDSNGTSAATYWFGYSKKANPVLWEAASPMAYVGPKTPPTLFLNSAVDRMHAGRDDYIAVLNENDVYNEVKEFHSAPHSFCLFHPWFEPTVDYIDRFLAKVLP